MKRCQPTITSQHTSASLVPVLFVSLLSSENSRQLGIVSFIQSCYHKPCWVCNYPSLVHIEDFEGDVKLSCRALAGFDCRLLPAFSPSSWCNNSKHKEGVVWYINHVSGICYYYIWVHAHSTVVLQNAKRGRMLELKFWLQINLSTLFHNLGSNEIGPDGIIALTYAPSGTDQSLKVLT